jgi:hypothetical protein
MGTQERDSSCPQLLLVSGNPFSVREVMVASGSAHWACTHRSSCLLSQEAGGPHFL